MSTSRDSGMSYLFDAPGTGRYRSGHDRAGTPLPWAAAGGAWVVWDVIGGSRLGAHVTSSGDVDWSATISPQSGFQPVITAEAGNKV